MWYSKPRKKALRPRVARDGNVWRGVCVAAAALLLAACNAEPDLPRLEVTVPWGIGGTQVVADLHTHSQFSDGAFDLESLVRKAYVAGCRAVAVTDNSDAQSRGGSKEYLAALHAVRKKYPQHILLSGIEWNVPPHAGTVQMGVLMDPAVEHHLVAFKQQFQDPRKSLADALGWLHAQVTDPTQAALIYNHPARHGESAESILGEWKRMRDASAQNIVFEGGPGHQNATPNGQYAMTPTVERWDPAITTVGGVWDQLLDRGENTWAALAFSAFRNTPEDFAPCEFSRTVLKVPEASASGVLKALHAGSFWASQGRFIDYFLFTVNTPGLPLPASPGEMVHARTGAPLTVRVAVERYPNAGSQQLMVEIIGNCAKGKTDVLAAVKLERNQSDTEIPLTAAIRGADGASCYLRARVRGQTANGDVALAHSNPVRVRLAPARP